MVRSDFRADRAVCDGAEDEVRIVLEAARIAILLVSGVSSWVGRHSALVIDLAGSEAAFEDHKENAAIPIETQVKEYADLETADSFGTGVIGAAYFDVVRSIADLESREPHFHVLEAYDQLG